MVYGPSKPHFGQTYLLPCFLHFSHLHITASPQLGQRKLVALMDGAIGLPQDVHLGRAIVVAILTPFAFRLSFLINFSRAVSIEKLIR